MTNKFVINSWLERKDPPTIRDIVNQQNWKYGEENIVILVSTDGSDLSTKAIETACNLAKSLGTGVLGMTVVKVVGSAQATERLEAIKRRAEELGVPCITEEVIGTSVPEAILNLAQTKNSRFIVMASRGLGTLGSLFIGSSTQQVLALADRPVLVVR